MIVKSLPRKTRSFGQLLGYINAPEELGRAIFHNLLTNTDNLERIEAEFLENRELLAPRKNGNILYHEVLSFGSADRAAVTPAILEDLTRTYLDLRAPYALAYAKAHLDTANPHVHLLISANNIGERKRLRLSRQEFREVKTRLEQVQRERYPQLRHSVVFERAEQSPRGHLRERRNESERSRRLTQRGEHRPSRKEQVRSTVVQTLAATSSGEDFYRHLQNQGLRLYRRGKSVAVEDLESGRKFRLRTLGLEEMFRTALAQWKAVPVRLQAIKNIQAGNTRQPFPNLGVRQELERLFDVPQRRRRQSRLRRQQLRDPPRDRSR